MQILLHFFLNCQWRGMSSSHSHEGHEVPEDVHLHDFRLTRGEAELGDEVRVVHLGVEVAAFRCRV